MSWLLLLGAALAWDERGPDGVSTGRQVGAAERFSGARPDWSRHVVAASPLATAGLSADLGVDLDDVLDTLDLVARVAEEDRGQQRPRLLDPVWLRAAAKARSIALDDGHIRLTKYVVYSVDGSPTRTERFDTALYAPPANQAAPLVWLTRDVYDVGLGKLVALEWPTPRGPELQRVVLADTGGAFQPNLFQPDYLAGTFPSRAAYDAWARDTPTRVPAAVLARRR